MYNPLNLQARNQALKDISKDKDVNNKHKMNCTWRHTIYINPKEFAKCLGLVNPDDLELEDSLYFE